MNIEEKKQNLLDAVAKSIIENLGGLTNETVKEFCQLFYEAAKELKTPYAVQKCYYIAEEMKGCGIETRNTHRGTFTEENNFTIKKGFVTGENYFVLNKTLHYSNSTKAYDASYSSGAKTENFFEFEMPIYNKRVYGTGDRSFCGISKRDALNVINGKNKMEEVLLIARKNPKLSLPEDAELKAKVIIFYHHEIGMGGRYPLPEKKTGVIVGDAFVDDDYKVRKVNRRTDGSYYFEL